jgi:hypothetical protein
MSGWPRHASTMEAFCLAGHKRRREEKAGLSRLHVSSARSHQAFSAVDNKSDDEKQITDSRPLTGSTEKRRKMAPESAEPTTSPITQAWEKIDKLLGKGKSLAKMKKYRKRLEVQVATAASVGVAIEAGGTPSSAEIGKSQSPFMRVAELSGKSVSACGYSAGSAAADDAKMQSLAVFFRRETDPGFSKVVMPADGDISRLKELIQAKLPSLKDTNPSTIVLRKEQEKNTFGPPLEDRMTLREAGVKHKDSLLVSVEIKPSIPPLPAPISFSTIELKSETWLTAEVPLSAGSTAPIFLTSAQHEELLRFIDERPSRRPQLLMPVGTIKSGKSVLLHEVLPGMVAARVSSSHWPDDRLQPVFFRYRFPLMADAEEAAMSLSRALDEFGKFIKVPFGAPADAATALDLLPQKLEKFARQVHKSGGELWLLFDEMQGPLLNSTPSMAQEFTHQFKEVVEQCSFYARIAVTGSSLTLMNAFQAARVNGFALWAAVSYLSLGRTPRRSVAKKMAPAIHRAYTSRWPSDIKAALSADRLVKELRAVANSRLTSPRPALMAYALQCMGDGSRGSAEEILSAALGTVREKLLMESVRDTATALAAMKNRERRVLRGVVDERYTHNDLRAIKIGTKRFNEDCHGIFPGALAHLIEHLSEPGSGTDKVRLQPPYDVLLQSWVCDDGDVTVGETADSRR